MNFNIAKKAIDLFFQKDGSEKVIKFFGGEPLIKFDLIKKCIEYVDGKARCEVVTNGTYLNKKKVDYFLTNNVEVSISFDFERKKEFQLISLFKENNSLLTATLVVKPQNVSNMFKGFEYLVNLKAKKINILPVVYTLTWKRAELRQFTKQFNKIAKLYWSIKNNGGEIILKGFEELEDEKLKESQLASHYYLVDTDGGVYCSDIVLLLAQKQKNKYMISNVDDKAWLDDNKISDYDNDLKKCWGTDIINSNKELKNTLDKANKLIKIL